MSVGTPTTFAQLDVAKEVKIDHDNVRDLLERYQTASNLEEKKPIASTLVREMAIHSDAEEVSVYNLFLTKNMVTEAEKDKEEHAQVKKMVYRADTTSMESADYDQVLFNAVQAFLVHAKEEEDVQLPKLVSMLTQEENTKAAQDFLKTRTMVPSRPHPWAPQTGGVAQKLAGAQGKLHDKVVETVTGREFVGLKLEHGNVEA
ncbi:hypothetical protein BDY24DRAFT_388896 [Mrakia frigida]|uniref:hemerythrin domain-containing protein n=1 Tax=Mrakia frigida TaxID=29902 RepID=UPI003FCBF80C